jgi:transcriptional regulator with XRE-family HTH domain
MNGAIRITDPDQLRIAIGDLRAIYGTTQRALAADSGFRQAQISNWLSGRTVPDPASVIRLANALGYDLALIPREDA